MLTQNDYDTNIKAYGEGMHWYGQTPDWYMCAAMVSYDIEDNADEASAFIMAEAEEINRAESSL